MSFASRWILSVAAALPGLGLVLAQEGALSGPPAPGPRPRVERFELRARPDGPAIGHASLHRTDVDGRTMLEWQVHFRAEELSIWHVETRDQDGERLVWREQAPRRGRTVVVERAGEAIEVTEWGRPQVWRATRPAPSTSPFPLELQERLRRGEIQAGSFAIFDPLSNQVDHVRVQLEPALPAAAEGESLVRRAELVRDDGSLAGSWTFAGQELVSFAWQRGGLVAVRIDERRHAEHLAQTRLAEGRLAHSEDVTASKSQE